ncbi:Dead-box protein, ATP-independent RNA helicase [Sulfitobacter noctilucicola]|uniref:ATP-dependent RNA helicase DeaD n=1 Tax=Sulfitobacter noctilucicola TaxID=1342301 RepID=A0A7W6Q2X9_9RHOB|nr:DEAD/DEAH box helicase [Sulfitobacter noctilucicola]KIN62466.1 Dead-box protein, ATP-independent RNA helicase [Sulfitobacter noctilucicola]MBB4173003.1 ATP-dependent RNA helicase DeaD [Sulfitobacter noctilucicola]
MIKTIADALAAQGYETLTAVQEAVTDPELTDQDLLVSAQTGSGKTVAFGLAIAPTLLGTDERFGPASSPLALVIAPTRELAMQVARELSWLYAQAGAVVTTCVGGMDQRTERRALDRGAHIVVATPGRLCDHIKRSNIDLSELRAVILDEADEMLDMGFREELEFILDEAPEDRRTLLFSATVPAAIAKLAKSYQRDAQRIATVGEAKQHADIEYRALNVHPRDTENAIINVLRFYEAKNAIVFCNTRAAVARLTTKFTNRGFSVVALSGELSQQERTNALQALRDGRARVCIATDVAARGIDLPNLELVIHADLPSNADTLLHRSGRTGRAGRKGVSALIVPPKMKTKANRLLGWAKLSATWDAAPSATEVMAADEARLLSDPAWSNPAPEDAAGFVASLTEKFTPEQLATAFVNLYRARASAPEDLTDPGSKDERPRPSFGPSVWFSVSTGRNDGAEPRTLLPMVCNKGDLTKDDVGAIRVQQDHSFVEILASSADKFMNALGPDRVIEDDTIVTRLDKAPDLPRGPKPGGNRGPKPGGKPHRRPAYDPDAPSAPARSRPARTESPAAEARFEKPKSDKPKFDKPKHKHADKPKGERPPKSHKTERSPMKPGAKPKPKSNGEEGGRPKSKAVWKKDGPKADAPRAGKDGKPKGGKPFKSREENSGGAKTYKRAGDPSKRFTPPNKIGKPKNKGGATTPRRDK